MVYPSFMYRNCVYSNKERKIFIWKWDEKGNKTRLKNRENHKNYKPFTIKITHPCGKEDIELYHSTKDACGRLNLGDDWVGEIKRNKFAKISRISSLTKHEFLPDTTFELISI
jgi:hypothetical protein